MPFDVLLAMADKLLFTMRAELEEKETDVADSAAMTFP